MSGGHLPTITVVVPVYNGQGTLAELVDRLVRALRQTSSRFEIVLVNDGSSDCSWEVICGLATQHDGVRGIDLMRNYGQHNALLAGIRAAQHDVIVTLDDDLQHPPEEIPRLIAKLGEGYDVVYGTPEHEQQDIWRVFASQFAKLALRSTIGVATARKVSAFRAFRTPVREAFAAYQSPFVSIDVLLTWGTTRFSAVLVSHNPRRVGLSNYTVAKLIIHTVDMMTGFSTLPLRLASLIGFVFTLFGLGVLVYVIARYLVEGGSVPGFPFLASIVAIFSGAQLFALGIMGEYLARMHFRMMEKPPYLVREHGLGRPG